MTFFSDALPYTASTHDMDVGIGLCRFISFCKYNACHLMDALQHPGQQWSS